jgi:D-glycero-D-manno-heptose 1,7-bisphosphate phosphatase
VPRNRALFLDRDGVINHHLGYTFTVDNFVFIDGIFEFCHAAMQAGYLLIIVTNQAGIGRGYFTEQDFLTLTEWMLKRFEEEGIKITDVFYCPYHPEFGIGEYKKDSFDRKPNPGMLLRAAEKYGLDLEHSIMIGDKDSDMQAASKACVGVRCHYLSDNNEQGMSNAATHKIQSPQEAISLLRESIAI